MQIGILQEFRFATLTSSGRWHPQRCLLENLKQVAAFALAVEHVELLKKPALQGIRQFASLRFQTADGFIIAGEGGFQFVDDGLMVFLLPAQFRFHELALANQRILLLVAEVACGTNVATTLAVLVSGLLHIGDFPLCLLHCLFESIDSLQPFGLLFA